MELSAKKIQEMALGGGMLLFIHSEAAAKQIADKAWSHLLKKGYGNRKREHTVFVEEGQRWKGTWSVKLFLGIPLHADPNDERTMIEDAKAALKASYNPAKDLVTSYTI